MTPNDDLERQLERYLRDPLTRRRLMKRGAAGALSLSALSYLAACGTRTGGVVESGIGQVPDEMTASLGDW